eukprot:12315895-Alexandrium_andersonii.AAC.1
MPHARFLARSRDNPDHWVAVDLQTFRQLHPKAFPRRGVLELLAQTTTIHFSHGNVHEMRRVIEPPKILQRCNASTIFNAVECHSQELSLDRILALAQRL